MSARLRRFALVNLVGVLAVFAVLAVFYRQVAVGAVEGMGHDYHVALNRVVYSTLRHVAAPLLQPPPAADATALRGRPEVALVDHVLRAQLRGLGVLRVKLYDATGLTVYSSDPSQIGESKADNPGVQAARADRVLSGIVHRDTFNSFDGVLEDRDLIQSYLPLHDERSGGVSGVFELYSDVTPLLQEVSRTQRDVVLGVMATLAVLYLVVVALYWQTDRALQAEERERNRYVGEVERANQTLEERVAERTRELESSRHRLQMVVDGVADPVLVVERDLKVTMMNAAARAAAPAGLAQSAHLLCCYEVAHGRSEPCAHPDHPCPMREVLASGRAYTVIHQHRSPEGEPVTVEVTATPLRGPGGEVSGIIEVIHDITGHLQAVEALRASEKRFRDVANAAGEYIWESDREGRLTFLTNRVQDVLGYSPEEMVGQRMSDFLPLDEGRRVQAYLRERPWGFQKLEHRCLTKAGRVMWQSISAVPVHDAGHRVIGYRGAGEDITVRKQAELALRDSEARLRAIMESVADAIMIVDVSGAVDLCNPAAERIFGYHPADALIGKDLAGLLPGLEPPRTGVVNPLRPPPLDLPVGGREARGRRRDGALFPADLWVGEMQLDGRRRFLVVVRDITQRKKTEKDLEDARQQYFHQDKMAAIGRLAAGILHEVGNPIAAISGAIQEILDQHRPAGPCPLQVCLLEEGEECRLQMIRSHTDRLAGITREIAEFATPRRGEPGLVNLNELARRAASLLRYDRRLRHIALKLDLDPQLPAIHGVGDKLTQVMMNLLINAADACEGLAERRPAIALITALDGSRVRLTVQDNGKGMDRETQEHAFEAFFTTKPPGKGTGLGLSLCHTLVSEHGGTIAIESTPDVGTRVHLYLPVDEAEPA